MKYAGTWHIYKMETWDEDYFSMEIQAFVRIDRKGGGEFQFGLVSGQIDGEVVREGADERFEFTWEGSDEMDPVSGSGWIELQGKDQIKGKFKIHLGDSSSFWAKQAK